VGEGANRTRGFIKLLATDKHRFAQMKNQKQNQMIVGIGQNQNVLKFVRVTFADTNKKGAPKNRSAL
jgi:hypothetical protein